MPVSYAGNSLMNAPKWSTSAGFNWIVPVGKGSLTTNAQYSCTAAKFTGYTNSPAERVGAVNLVNASVNWGPDDSGWKLGVYARNLFNEKYFNQK